MTNNDTARPQHTQYMSRIHTPIWNLRVMRVNPTQHKFVLHSRDKRSHPRAEKARSGAKIPRFPLHTCCTVCRDDKLIDMLDLVAELSVAEGARRLIVHSVITQLVSMQHQILQDRLVLMTVDLCANDEESGCSAALLQEVHDFACMLGRGIVYGECDHSLGCVDLPEDVRPSPAEVVDQKSGWFVDYVEW